MFDRLLKSIRYYSGNSRGNISVLTAVLLVPLLIGIGVAVDWSKTTTDVQNAQAAADTAVLAASKEYYRSFRKRSARKSGNEFGDINFHQFNGSDGYKTKTKMKRRADGGFKIETTISGKTKHSFMGMFGKPATPWQVKSVSNVNSPPEIEIMLVLDISDSMINNNKLNRMKTAVEEFITDVKPFRVGSKHLTISIIPFGGSVNLGRGSDSWLSPVNGLAASNQFNGCFRVLNGNTQGVGSLQAYRQGFAGRRRSPLCPKSNSDVFLFSQDQDALNNHVKKLETSWGTDTPQGLLWARRFLDNSWRENARSFSDGKPIPVNAKTHKVVILLTDGAVAVVDRNQDGKTERRKLPVGQSIALFDKECELIEQIPNISVYTIGYDVPPGVFTNALKRCVSGHGQYYEANLDGLDAAFKAINESLEPIRIVN